jgi:hypothetical protein
MEDKLFTLSLPLFLLKQIIIIVIKMGGVIKTLDYLNVEKPYQDFLRKEVIFNYQNPQLKLV